MNLKLVLGLALLCMTTSCATLLGTKGSKGAYISTNVGEAKVFDSRNRVIGTTPLFYQPTGNMEQVLTIEKEGYKSQTIKVSLIEQKEFAFLDAMLLCIPCLIDYPTGNIYKISQDSFNIRLVKEYPKDVERVVFLYNDITWEAKDGNVLGNDMKDPIYFRKSFFDSYLYKSELCGGASGSRYYIANCSSDADDDNKLVLNANTIEINPIIKNLKINTTKVKGNTVRSISMDVTWKLSKRGGLVIREIPVSLSEKAERIENKPLMARMLRESFKEILDNDETYKVLLAESKTGSGAASVHESINLSPVTVPLFNRNKDLVQYLMKGVVTIKHDEGHGSGFIISKDGYLITNYHVIKNKKTVNVQFSESLTLTADVVRGDDRYDVALLKISGSGFTPLEIINSDSALAGEDVFAIGTPEDISLGQSVTKGVISGKRKIAEKIYLQTDVAINPGNSGGPLLNEDGKVIGMVTMKLTGVNGIGFCVPTNTILEVLNLHYK